MRTLFISWLWLFILGAQTLAEAETHRPEETLQRFAEAYVEGDIGGVASCLWGPGDHNGDSFEAALYGYDRMFNEISRLPRRLTFYDVIVAEEPTPTGRIRITTWVNVQGRIACGGPMDVEMNRYGYIEKMNFRCTQDGTVSEEGFDGAITGQAADVATTAVGMAAGFAEANPIVSGIGLPIAAVLKIGAGKAAENLPVEDCHQVKDGLAISGWGLAGWNLCVLGTGGVGTVPCVVAGLVAAGVAEKKTSLGNLMVCRAKLPGEKFAMIDETGIYAVKRE